MAKFSRTATWKAIMVSSSSGECTESFDLFVSAQERNTYSHLLLLIGLVLTVT